MRITNISDLTIGCCICWKFTNKRNYFIIEILNFNSVDFYVYAGKSEVNAISRLEHDDMFKPGRFGEEVYDSIESAKLQYPEDFI